MDGLYESMYAYLVGQVDEVLTELDAMLADGALDGQRASYIRERLEAALQNCEEQYIRNTEKPVRPEK